MERLDAVAEYKKLTNSRNFKTANNLYAQARTNEKFDTGIQWDGISSKNLRKTTYNFVGQTNGIKNASILANELATNRTADSIDDDNEHVQEALEAYNMADAKNWERLKMDAMNEQLVFNGSIEGLGVSYWYWDNDIKTGNTFVVQGDIDGQLVDSVNLYVANPQQVDIQKQPWNKITIDMTVSELRAYAEKKGVSKEDAATIMADEQEIAYRAFEKADYEQDNDSTDQLSTLVVNFKKVDGKMYKSESTKDMLIEDWKDIDMTLYPISIFPYKPRKSFIYGEAGMTRYIENQIAANIQMAARTKHALLMAIPKIIVNESVTGSFSPAIGSVNKVKLPPGSNINTSAIAFLQPTAMSSDVDKSVEDNITRTQDLDGVNQNIQGAARPENAAALLTQIKQAAIPLESYKRRLYKYIEDTLLIWQEFYKTKYNMTRKYKTDDGEDMEFVGTDYADVLMNVTIDVGPSTQWSEITSFQMLLDLWDRNIIKHPQQVLTRLPKNSITKQNELIEDDKTEQLIMMMIQALGMPPELQEEFAQMETEEKVEMIQGILSTMGGQPNEVPSV